MALEPVPAMPSVVVIAHDDPGTAESLRHAVEVATGWHVVVAEPNPTGMAGALAADPSIALVGCNLLANLPTGRRTPLIAIGDDDRSADVRAAIAAGARSLLAWPDGVADLPGELARVAAIGQTHHPVDAGSGLIVATRGVHGGAGATTVAVHLAAAWARWGPAPALLVDLAGGLAFRLDLGAAPTWSALATTTGTAMDTAGPFHSTDHGFQTDDLTVPMDGASLGGSAGRDETGVGGSRMDDSSPSEATGEADMGDDRSGADAGWPVRVGGRDGPVSRSAIDAGALVGSLAEPWAGLAILPLAGLVDGAPDPPPAPWFVDHVLEAARTAYRLVVLDLPAMDGPAVQAALAQADALVAVGRCETAGVRGLRAALESWTAAGRDPDAAGAVVTGVRPQAPLAPREVRAALGDRLWALIPGAAAELAAAAEDGVILLERHDLPAVQAMLTLANRVVPFAAVSA